MAHEVELKLRIQARDIPRLLKHPALLQHCDTPPITRKLTSIYYDTPQLSLLDQALSLRVRRMSGQWFQAVKAAGHSLAGLHQRMEWEDIIASGHPDFSKIIDPALTQVFDDSALRAALRPIFTTEVKRTEWQLHLNDDSRIEVALDVGALIAGESREAIREIELELKHGEAARLFELALALQADIPLWIENVSKAERGYGCYRPRLLNSNKPNTVTLDETMSATQAFRSLCWASLTHLQGNHDITLEGQDIEGCHQMRVALRRLGAVLRCFRQLLGKADYRELRADIHWLNTQLGHARDLDVFVHATLPPLMATLQDSYGLITLHQKALAARKKAYREAGMALQSQRYHHLLLKLGAVTASTRNHRPQPDDLGHIARKTLETQHRKLRRQGRKDHRSPRRRHALRIAAKQMRYTLDAFSTLFPAKKAQAYLAALTDLQSLLGEMNDWEVAKSHAAALMARSAAASRTEACGILDAWAESKQQQGLDLLEKTWRKLERRKRFWR